MMVVMAVPPLLSFSAGGGENTARNGEDDADDSPQ